MVPRVDKCRCCFKLCTAKLSPHWLLSKAPWFMVRRDAYWHAPTLLQRFHVWKLLYKSTIYSLIYW